MRLNNAVVAMSGHTAPQRSLWSPRQKQTPTLLNIGYGPLMQRRVHRYNDLAPDNGHPTMANRTPPRPDAQGLPETYTSV